MYPKNYERHGSTSTQTGVARLASLSLDIPVLGRLKEHEVAAENLNKALSSEKDNDLQSGRESKGRDLTKLWTQQRVSLTDDHVDPSIIHID